MTAASKRPRCLETIRKGCKVDDDLQAGFTDGNTLILRYQGHRSRTGPENDRLSDGRSNPRAAAADGVIRSDCEYEPMIASTSHAM